MDREEFAKQFIQRGKSSGASKGDVTMKLQVALNQYDSQFGEEQASGGESSFLGDIGKALVKPAVDYGKMVAGAAYEVPRGIKANLNQDYSGYMDEGGNEIANPFLDQKEVEQFSDAGSASLEGTKRAAGMASYFMPASAAGAVGAGSMYGFSQTDDDAGAGEYAVNTGVGAVSGLAGYGASKVAGSVLSKGKKKVVDYASKSIKSMTDRMVNALDRKAVQQITQASPTVDRNFVTGRGKSVMEAVKKYIPENMTDEMIVGPENMKGKGGVLQGVLVEAEKKIQKVVTSSGDDVKVPGDTIVLKLEEQVAKLESQVGNTKKAEVLRGLILEVQQKYAKGVTVGEAMKTLRAGNEAFGKSVLDIDTASAVVSSTQKAEANALRAYLKDTFPEIAEALEAQADILALRPMMIHARAIGSTQGSTIRKTFASLFEITKPFQAIDGLIDVAVAGNTQRATSFLHRGTAPQRALSKIPQITNRFQTPDVVNSMVSGGLSRVPQLTGAGAGLGNTPPNL